MLPMSMDMTMRPKREQAVLGEWCPAQRCPWTVQELPDHHLRKQEHRHEIGGEETAHVAPRDDERGVDHELATPEHPGGQLDVGGAELQRDVAQEEEVHQAAHGGGGDGEPAPS